MSAVPLTSNGATAEPMPTDHKIDPSIGQAITHGGDGSTQDASQAPGYTATAPNGVPSSGATQAMPEKSGSMDQGGTTTTTTIIGGPSNGSTIASPVGMDGASTMASPHPNNTSTAPTSPVQGGNMAGVGSGSALSTQPTDTRQDSALSPTTSPSHTTNGSAVPAAAAGAAGAAGGAAAVNHHDAGKTEQPKQEVIQPMNPKEAKKYTKLLKKESKNEEKELAHTLKSAHSDEKAMRKARKAEEQSIKRHHSAVDDEHKASKALNKAKLAHEKAAAALQKATEELDIKKRHTAATSESYDKVKSKIDTLRDEKIAHDKDRARRQSSITQAANASK